MFEKLFDSVEEDERKPSRYLDQEFKRSRDFRDFRSRYERTRREESFDD